MFTFDGSRCIFLLACPFDLPNQLSYQTEQPQWASRIQITDTSTIKVEVRMVLAVF